MNYNVFSELDDYTRCELAALEIHLYLQDIFSGTGLTYRCVLNSCYAADLDVYENFNVDILNLKNNEALAWYDKNIETKLSDTLGCIFEAFGLSYDFCNNSEEDFTLYDLLISALQFIDNAFCYEKLEYTLDLE